MSDNQRGIVANVDTKRLHRSLYSASWFIVFYTVLIILWGAWVRYSGSGDGCGDHWPLCNGDVVPQAALKKTWIEFSHRLSTGIYGLLVVAQIALTRRRFSMGHPSRFWAWMTLLFTITEALIGRQLVKSGLVNESLDLARVVVMPLHLVNTSLLLFSCVMTAESVRYGTTTPRAFSAATKRRLTITVVALAILLTTGAIAALGSHLSPSMSLLGGLSNDLSSSAHPAVRLRILHPLLALLLGMGLIISASWRDNEAQTSADIWSARFTWALGIALCLGVATLVLLSPLLLKTLHLLMTNILVILFSTAFFHARRPQELPTHTRESL